MYQFLNASFSWWSGCPRELYLQAWRLVDWPPIGSLLGTQVCPACLFNWGCERSTWWCLDVLLSGQPVGGSLFEKNLEKKAQARKEQPPAWLALWLRLMLFWALLDFVFQPWGFPLVSLIMIDTHFTSTAIKELCKVQKPYCPYHPQSIGKIELMGSMHLLLTIPTSASPPEVHSLVLAPEGLVVPCAASGCSLQSGALIAST